MSKKLTPYDTGARAEPKLWPLTEDDNYGRVDFDNDESATLASVHLEPNPSGGYTLKVTSFIEPEDLTVEVIH